MSKNIFDTVLDISSPKDVIFRFGRYTGVITILPKGGSPPIFVFKGGLAFDSEDPISVKPLKQKNQVTLGDFNVFAKHVITEVLRSRGGKSVTKGMIRRMREKSVFEAKKVFSLL